MWEKNFLYDIYLTGHVVMVLSGMAGWMIWGRSGILVLGFCQLILVTNWSCPDGQESAHCFTCDVLDQEISVMFHVKLVLRFWERVFVAVKTV